MSTPICSAISLKRLRVTGSLNYFSTYYTEETASDANSHILGLTQTEKYVFGSSRLGVNKWSEPATSLYDFYAYFSSGYSDYRRGWRQYELSNHLGNVLVTVSDKKIGVDNNSDGNVDYYSRCNNSERLLPLWQPDARS